MVKRVTAPPVGDRKLKTLDRVLSKAGLGSRNDARKWIEGGRVRVNGLIARDADRWIDLEHDRVALDDEEITSKGRLYLLLHKPKGYLTTYRDKENRPTVYDLLPRDGQYLFPVGRLDLDTSGLLIMTNDSEFAELLTNPAFKVEKTYRVTSSSNLSPEQLESLRQGVVLKDGATRPAELNLLRQTFGKTIFELTITEGRNRQVRRMLEAVGSSVEQLIRVAIGEVRLEDLPSGASRELTQKEKKSLGAKG